MRLVENKPQKERYQGMGEGEAVEALAGPLLQMELKENPKPGPKCLS